MSALATIPGLTSQDVSHLRMAAYNLASIATDNGFATMAAKLADLPANDNVELVRYVNELWDAIAITLMQKARTQLDGLN